MTHQVAATPARSSTDGVLAATGLVKRFGDRLAVDDVTFAIPAGETYGLLGPNGAGKTTTIRLVCGLLHADAGHVVVGGTAVSPASTAGRGLIGYVPQDVALYPDLTARENLTFFGRLYRLRGKVLRDRVDEVLELIGLADRAKDKVESFSGGMRRRLNIGAGLLHRPTLLVLDEPTVGVDPQSRHAIMESVHRFGAGGMAVLYTTHDMAEAERLCDRVGIIDHGRLIAEGTRRELVDRLGERDRITLSASGDLVGFATLCRDLPGIEGADATGTEVHLIGRDGRKLLPSLFAAAERAGVAVRSAEVAEPDLEAVFLHLTGTALRD
ncbi:ABC-2 type transport system ATP-binding protein [Amycolatopsis lexingtonensis]|uniref:ABC-2 type transport system ATP-binding protein n=1 Tax=Amycolatopsis lexingtonensis TaxID=218822 RepID=A0ABR9HXI0_9PSEU|nr:ABC transporter ATP-binding protein [Amycolatopsis lexingtonensis]MBE1495645.1 ABC-2 type transport system ATP-binding protein [Amycolatopsis lexingtonensis]